MENVEREKMGSQDNWGFLGLTFGQRGCKEHFAMQDNVLLTVEPPCLLPVAEVDYLNTLINRNHKSDVAI